MQANHSGAHGTQNDHHHRRTRLDQSRHNNPDQKESQIAKSSNLSEIHLIGNLLDGGLHKVKTQKQHAKSEHE